MASSSLLKVRLEDVFLQLGNCLPETIPAHIRVFMLPKKSRGTDIRALLAAAVLDVVQTALDEFPQIVQHQDLVHELNNFRNSQIEKVKVAKNSDLEKAKCVLSEVEVRINEVNQRTVQALDRFSKLVFMDFLPIVMDLGQFVIEEHEMEEKLKEEKKSNSSANDDQRRDSSPYKGQKSNKKSEPVNPSFANQQKEKDEMKQNPPKDGPSNERSKTPQRSQTNHSQSQPQRQAQNPQSKVEQSKSQQKTKDQETQNPQSKPDQSKSHQNVKDQGKTNLKPPQNHGKSSFGQDSKNSSPERPNVQKNTPNTGNSKPPPFPDQARPNPQKPQQNSETSPTKQNQHQAKPSPQFAAGSAQPKQNQPQTQTKSSQQPQKTQPDQSKTNHQQNFQKDPVRTNSKPNQNAAKSSKPSVPSGDSKRNSKANHKNYSSEEEEEESEYESEETESEEETETKKPSKPSHPPPQPTRLNTKHKSGKSNDVLFEFLFGENGVNRSPSNNFDIFSKMDGFHDPLTSSSHKSAPPSIGRARVEAYRRKLAESAAQDQTRSEISRQVGIQLERWELNPQGRRKSLKSLLISVDQIISDGSLNFPESSLQTESDLKKAVRKIQSYCHPDRQLDKPISDRLKAERIFQAITSAFELYKNQQQQVDPTH
jgi:hypothetical protein